MPATSEAPVRLGIKSRDTSISYCAFRCITTASWYTVPFPLNCFTSLSDIGIPYSMEKCCPVCGSQLTLKQAIEILNGSGCVQVKRADGLIDYLPANLVNPRAV